MGPVLLLFRGFSNVGRDESRLAELQWSHQDKKPRLFHGPWRDPARVHKNHFLCGAMWDMEGSMAMVSLNIY